MNLLPIDIDDAQNKRFVDDPECVPILEVLIDFYVKVGFNKPWICYFMSNDKSEIVGGGGFKGRPKEGKVEISYGTFKKYEGRGIGTVLCRHLVLLALETDPSIRITARTLPDNNASMKVLKKNGFKCLGTVFDEEDGDVLEWEFIKNNA